MNNEKPNQKIEKEIKDEISIIDILESEEENIHVLGEQHLQRVEKLITEYKGNIKARLTEEEKNKYKWSDKLSDRIAAFGGSWTFIVIFAIFLTAWTVLNSLSFFPHFDPPPFILLNLCLSFIAAFQAPIILMSQNRQSARDKNEAMIDFAINYKAEEENVEMQKQLKRIEHMLNELIKQQNMNKQ